MKNTKDKSTHKKITTEMLVSNPELYDQQSTLFVKRILSVFGMIALIVIFLLTGVDVLLFIGFVLFVISVLCVISIIPLAVKLSMARNKLARKNINTDIDANINIGLNSNPIKNNNTGFYMHINGPKLRAFPEHNKQGLRISDIQDIFVTGSMHEQNGIDPQLIIGSLERHEKIILAADPTNTHDSKAVQVKTYSGDRVGWLPRESFSYDRLGYNLKELVFDKLQAGEEVVARVSNIYELDKYPGNLGFDIEIAFYK